MSDQSGGITLDGSQRIDTSRLKLVRISEASEELFQRMMAAQETLLRDRYMQIPDVANHPAYQPYATVKVGGRAVATLDNNGFLTTSNALGVRLEGKIPDSVNGRSGPLLAQARAEAVARLLGGTVAVADTALTQQGYESLSKPTVTYDTAAMVKDPIYRQMQESRAARLLFLAQQMA